MNSKKIEIEVPNGKKPEWVNGVLTLVDEKPKNVLERIKERCPDIVIIEQ